MAASAAIVIRVRGVRARRLCRGQVRGSELEERGGLAKCLPDGVTRPTEPGGPRISSAAVTSSVALLAVRP